MTEQRELLADLIKECGGLHSKADLARRWDVTRQAAYQMTLDRTFPKPVAHIGRSPIFTGKEADAWLYQPRH